MLDKEEIFHIREVYYKTNASGPYKGIFLQNVKVLGLLTLPSIITVEREKKLPSYCLAIFYWNTIEKDWSTFLFPTHNSIHCFLFQIVNEKIILGKELYVHYGLALSVGKMSSFDYNQIVENSLLKVILVCKKIIMFNDKTFVADSHKY